MIEQDTIKLLRECDAGIKMGITSSDDAQSHGHRQNLALAHFGLFPFLFGFLFYTQPCCQGWYRAGASIGGVRNGRGKDTFRPHFPPRTAAAVWALPGVTAARVPFPR